jgi:hypothetical protein
MLWLLTIINLVAVFLLWLGLGRVYYLIKMGAQVNLEIAQAMKGIHIRLVLAETILGQMIEPTIPPPPPPADSGPMVN